MKRRIILVMIVWVLLVVMSVQCIGLPDKRDKHDENIAVTYCALNDALRMGRETHWKGADNFLAATKYIQVIVGKKATTFTREGKYLNTGRSEHKSAGLMGDYAEAYWELLDKDKKVFSDTFACMILRYRNGKWTILAKGGSDGYEDSWKGKGIPKSVIRRLKLA